MVINRYNPEVKKELELKRREWKEIANNEGMTMEEVIEKYTYENLLLKERVKEWRDKMEKDDLIVGRVKLNPTGNDMCPCIKVIMSKGMSHNDLILLKVIDSQFDNELLDALEDKE